MINSIYYTDINEVKETLSNNYIYTQKIPKNIKTVIDMNCMYILGPFQINGETTVFIPIK